MDDWLLGFAFAFFVSAVTTPAGVSGAVFVLPFQVSVLEVPSPAVTPTNLLYNLVAIPGALLRYARDGALWTPLTRLLILGAMPGAVIGAVIRVEVLDGPEAFLVVVGAVLAPLGLLLLRAPRPRRSDPPNAHALVALAMAVGIVGGIYGIGGGSILAPVLVTLGLSVRAVAPSALASTFLTSLAGIAAFAFLSLGADENIAPDWVLGLFLGAGGLAGGYLGASLQPRIPERTLRTVLGLLALALGVRYLVVGLG